VDRATVSTISGMIDGSCARQIVLQKKKRTIIREKLKIKNELSNAIKK